MQISNSIQLMDPVDRIRFLSWILLFLTAFTIGGCGQPHATPAEISLTPSPPASTPSPRSTRAVVLPTSPTTTPSLMPTATNHPLTIWLDPSLPSALKAELQLPSGYTFTKQRDKAWIRIEHGLGERSGWWTYVLVSPFPSLKEEISADTLRAFWQGQGEGLYGTNPIYISADTLSVFSAQWGEPAPGSVVVLPESDILDRLWPDPEQWAILPFHELSPRWKVLGVEGQNPILNEFEPRDYPLSIAFSASGSGADFEKVSKQMPSLSNRNPEQMTHVIVTGVTAMVRDTASLMEEKGITYPARQIGNLLRSADFTHVSNEVPFAEDCPKPDSDQQGFYFCSPDRYLELLDYIGTDIVELSGDHFGDWGTDAMYHTLDLYEAQGWKIYGGGRTYQEGLQPIQINHHGNRIAFIGCNAKAAKKYATATDTEPGASRCDFVWMRDKISSLAQEGFITIATMQHDETYQYKANFLQQRDFRSLADAGADIVSGSQAHQPQAIEFHNGALIHYGLGNLFFDQYLLSQRVEKYKNADQATIDMHVFYRNKHISTILFPIQFIDNAQSRFMDPVEKKAFLSDLFHASEW